MAERVCGGEGRSLGGCNGSERVTTIGGYSGGRMGVEDRLATKEECREHETGVGGRVPLYPPSQTKEAAEGKRKKLRPVSPRGERSLECWCAARGRPS